MSELSAEVIAAANRILAKREREMDKRRERLAKKYPFTQPDTLVYEEASKRFLVVCECPECGEEHSRQTQDLKQTEGRCPNCQEARRKAKAKEKTDLLAKAMQAIRDGKI
jgi:ssDNA-binding Zn-finger/Zn-ribbon topoisomerase 1